MFLQTPLAGGTPGGAPLFAPMFFKNWLFIGTKTARNVIPFYNIIYVYIDMYVFCVLFVPVCAADDAVTSERTHYNININNANCR